MRLKLPFDSVAEVETPKDARVFAMAYDYERLEAWLRTKTLKDGDQLTFPGSR